MAVIPPGSSRPTVVAPGDGRQLHMGANSVEHKLEGPGDFSVVEYTACPGWQPPYRGLGRHTRESSGIYVLEGELVYTFDDVEVTVQAGTFVHIPMGAWFGWRNDRSEPARFLVIFAPAGFEQIFTDIMDELGDRSTHGEAIAGVVDQQHVVYGMERQEWPS